MKVLLISANTEQINMPTLPLGLVCVATATEKAGHEVKILDLMVESNTHLIIKDTLKEFFPDIIGISVRNIDDQTMRNTKFLLDQVVGVISDCRNLSDAPIILGGAGYSIFPESTLNYVGAEFGIQGEAEVAFPALLARLQKGADLTGIPGLYMRDLGLQGKRNFPSNLDTVPLPDPNLWHSCNLNYREVLIPFQIKRGCPLHCNYCSTAIIEGGVIRKRSPETVVKGIALHVRAGFRSFYFTDSIFNIPQSYATEICRMLIDHRVGISWRCILYPERIDEELVQAMAKAGCNEVSLGFESGSERILQIMEKKFRPKDVRQTSEILADHGIRQTGFLLLGGPGETRETVEESLAFADSLPLDLVKLTLGIRIYPLTKLAKTAIEEGIIDRTDNLLFPKFYLVRGIEDWLYETVETWMAERPHWMM